MEKAGSASYILINGKEVGYNEGGQKPGGYNLIVRERKIIHRKQSSVKSKLQSVNPDGYLFKPEFNLTIEFNLIATLKELLFG